MKKLRVGLVGTGGMGKVHYANYQYLADDFEVAAVCDNSEPSVKVAEEWDLPRYLRILTLLGSFLNCSCSLSLILSS